MSVYNGEKYFREAIDSILNQTFTDFEFIIINDDSTDNTSKILNSYHDQRIKIITNLQNIGLTKSLNIGLQHCHGKYVARLDADDISLPNRLLKQSKFLDENQNIVLIGSLAAIIDSQKKIIETKKKPTDPLVIKFKLLTNNTFLHPSIMFHRKLILQNGGYNEIFRFAQDYDLYSRLSLKYSLANIPEVLIYYRLNPNSITSNLSSRKEQCQNASFISHQNINHYLPLTPNQVASLLKTLNNDNPSIQNLITGLFIYHRLFKSFIRKEGQNQTLLSLYRQEQKSILKRIIKKLFFI